jgi:UDP-glucose 4-epimerase
MSKAVLVTGGAGFIGSHLTNALAQSGASVRVFDNFSTGLRSNLEGIRPAPQVIEGDLTDAAALMKASAGVETVFHLGALASVQLSVESPTATHAACATGTLNVLDAARRSGVRRVVYAASSSAYGGPSSATGQCETDPTLPLSPYAAAKLAGELYAKSFHATFGLETVCLRFFNIFGPKQRADSPYSGVIALFIDAMTNGRIPTVHGDGLQSRDFTYVDNVVQALSKAAQAPRAAGEVYNVGTGQSVTVLDLINTLNQILKTNLVPQHGPTRAGDVRFSMANIDKARRDLGYEPTVTFADGLRKTVEWHLACRAK